MRFDMIGFFVKNLPTMVDFYHDVIGLHIDWDGNGPYAEFQHEGIRFTMFDRKLLPELLGQQPAYTSGINGTFELTLDFQLFEDIDREFERAV